MTHHRPAYNIERFPGCAGAAMQAVASADRRRCAFVSALATMVVGERLQGTLYRAADDVLEQYIADSCAEYGVPLERAEMWARSVAELDTFPRLPDGATFAEMTLHPFQITSIASLTPAGGALGLFCGAGKTVTGAAAAAHLMKSFRYTPRLWIGCPLNAMPAWERMRPHLAPHFSEIRVFSIDSAHKYIALAPTGGVIIFDELHLLGGKDTRRTASCHELRSKFDAGIGLTGTLVHSGVEACLSYADLCVPGMALFGTKWAAGAHWKCLAQKQLGPRTVTALEKPTGVNRDRFLAWLARWCYMLRPESPEVVANLTVPVQNIHEVHLGEPWRDTRHDVAEIANRIFDETGELPHAQEVMHELAHAHVDDKIQYLMDRIDPSEQITIAAYYRESLDAMEEALKTAKISYVRVDGDITGADRAECERKFQENEVKVFLGQMHAASVSMNLQCSDISFTLDVSWSTIDYEQWLFRTRRQGKGKDRVCNHIDLIANKFQAAVVDRVRRGMDFSAECSMHLEVKQQLKEVIP